MVFSGMGGSGGGGLGAMPHPLDGLYKAPAHAQGPLGQGAIISFGPPLRPVSDPPMNELVSSQSVQCTHDSTEVGHNVELLNLKNQQIRMVEQVQFDFDYENRFQQRVYY